MQQEVKVLKFPSDEVKSPGAVENSARVRSLNSLVNNLIQRVSADGSNWYKVQSEIPANQIWEKRNGNETWEFIRSNDGVIILERVKRPGDNKNFSDTQRFEFQPDQGNRISYRCNRRDREPELISYSGFGYKDKEAFENSVRLIIGAIGNPVSEDTIREILNVPRREGMTTSLLRRVDNLYRLHIAANGSKWVKEKSGLFSLVDKRNQWRLIRQGASYFSLSLTENADDEGKKILHVLSVTGGDKAQITYSEMSGQKFNGAYKFKATVDLDEVQRKADALFAKVPLDDSLSNVIKFKNLKEQK